MKKVAAAIDRWKERQALYSWKDAVHNDKVGRIDSRIKELKELAGNSVEEIKKIENDIETVRASNFHM